MCCTLICLDLLLQSKFRPEVMHTSAVLPPRSHVEAVVEEVSRVCSWYFPWCFHNAATGLEVANNALLCHDGSTSKQGHGCSYLVSTRGPHQANAAPDFSAKLVETMVQHGCQILLPLLAAVHKAQAHAR